MVSVISSTIFKQTFVPFVNYLKYVIYGSKGPSKCKTDATENQEERGLTTGHESCKPNNCQTTYQSRSFNNNSYISRFYAEQSMHPACSNYTKTRLHSLHITKSLENPVTCESPWNQFLGGCRWYSLQTGQNKLQELSITKDIKNPETCVSPWNQFLDGSRWYSKKAVNDSVKDAVARLRIKGGNVKYSMGDNVAIRSLKKDLKRLQE